MRIFSRSRCALATSAGCWLMAAALSADTFSNAEMSPLLNACSIVTSHSPGVPLRVLQISALRAARAVAATTQHRRPLHKSERTCHGNIAGRASSQRAWTNTVAEYSRPCPDMALTRGSVVQRIRERVLQDTHSRHLRMGWSSSSPNWYNFSATSAARPKSNANACRSSNVSVSSGVYAR